ncbi:hypothetical protein AUP74_01798 [Microbulbifer aggregans]|uniref:Polysaccharide deacetylase n=1 Tax=Microbulbifer aggregans TaxID=1769779 RepID=A0A1C9W7T8_9GAMM|nr:hypothetical protein [Microbulbifer aggregans]AOS97229.1 hypothetical protein AUP74_01798 [Microbulbifer aggregans]
MKIFLTLNYELFIGCRSGSVSSCLINSTNVILNILRKFNAQAVIFVDASYLVRLKGYVDRFPNAARDYNAVTSHVKELEAAGHQIQLIVHPHWWHSVFDGESWTFNSQPLSPASLSRETTVKMIKESIAELNSHLHRKVFAFRVGGLCPDGWEAAPEILRSYGVMIDCGNKRHSRSPRFPHFGGSLYREENHSREHSVNEQRHFDMAGGFLERRVSTMNVGPSFFWKAYLARMLAPKSLHMVYGDGVDGRRQTSSLIQKLTKKSQVLASIDGLNSSLLIKSYRDALSWGHRNYTVVGHPKLLTDYSIANLKSWLDEVYRHGDSLGVIEEPVWMKVRDSMEFA